MGPVLARAAGADNGAPGVLGVPFDGEELLPELVCVGSASLEPLK